MGYSRNAPPSGDGEAGFDFAAVEDLLVCPVARRPLVHPEPGSLVSCDPETRLRYRVDDGIPVLLPDSGEELPRGEWETIMRSEGRDPDTGEKASA